MYSHSKYFLSILLFSFFISIGTSQSLENCNYIIVAHQNQTNNSNWDENLLELLSKRGFIPGLLLVDNGDFNYDIKNQLTTYYNSGVELEYVLLVGNGKNAWINSNRNEFDYQYILHGAENNLVDNQLGNYIPFFYISTESPYYKMGTIVATDDPYIEDCRTRNEIYIGRLPITSAQEGVSYVNKISSYLNEFYNYTPNNNRLLYLGQDVTSPWNHCKAENVNAIRDNIISQLSEKINITTLNISEHSTANDWFTHAAYRDQLFEYHINQGSSLIYTIGTHGGPIDLCGWYNTNLSNFGNMTNIGSLPFVLSPNCHQGEVNHEEDDPVLRKLITLSSGGIIGALAPTDNTFQQINSDVVDRFNMLFFENNISLMGNISKNIKLYLKNTYPNVGFYNLGLTLFGDPSLPISAFQNIDGQITGKVELSGKILIENSVIIIDGSELVLKAGTVLYMEENSNIYIEAGGKLSVIGTIDYPVVLKAASTSPENPGYWEGIINKGGTTNIGYCVIEDAFVGISITKGDGEISNSEFRNNVNGITMNYADNYGISGNLFTDNETGMIVAYSSPSIKNNIYIDNIYYGIQSFRSNSKIRENEFTNNGEFGIKIANRSQVDLSTVGQSHPTVNNLFNINGSGNIYVEVKSDPNIGRYMVNGGSTFGGFNQFINRGNTYDIVNYAERIFAMVNWWDREMRFDGPGEIITDPTADFLFGPPAKTTGSQTDSIPPELMTALLFELNEEWVSAIPIFESLIQSYQSEPWILKALYGQIRCMSQIGEIEVLDNTLLSYYSVYGNTPLGIASYDYSITLNTHNNNYDESLNRSLQLLQVVEGTDYEPAVLVEQGLIYEFIADQEAGIGKVLSSEVMQQKALDNYNTVLTSFPQSSSSEIAAWLLGKSHKATYEDENNIEYIPEGYALYTNFPNPFNPVTTIKYDLPEKSNVLVVVYDIMGQEVKTLKNDLVEAGTKRLMWNGVNLFGNKVSSGVYLYVITAKSLESDNTFTDKKKMILLK